MQATQAADTELVGDLATTQVMMRGLTVCLLQSMIPRYCMCASRKHLVAIHAVQHAVQLTGKRGGLSLQSAWLPSLTVFPYNLRTDNAYDMQAPTLEVASRGTLASKGVSRAMVASRVRHISALCVYCCLLFDVYKYTRTD